MKRRNILENLSAIFSVGLLLVIVIPSPAGSYYIRNREFGASIDATDPLNIIINSYNKSSPYQRWFFQPTYPGRFNIINEGWWLALNHSFDGNSHKATLAAFSLNDAYQQWFINSDQTIVSDYGNEPNYGLAAAHSGCTSRSPVVLSEHRFLGAKDMFVIWY